MHKSMESQLMRSNAESMSSFSLKGGTLLPTFSGSILEQSTLSIFQRANLLDQISIDQDACEAPVDRYQQSLFDLIYHTVGEYYKAQDVLHQVWLKPYLSLATIHPIVSMHSSGHSCSE